MAGTVGLKKVGRKKAGRKKTEPKKVGLKKAGATEVEPKEVGPEKGGRKKVEWLVMLYLSGDNNLSPDMVWAINEIRESGIPDDFALTIQYDGVAPGSATYLYAVDEDTAFESGPCRGPIPFPEAMVHELPEDNAANPEVLAEFIRWSADLYEAAHRMLILSGHGSGTIGDFLADDHAGVARQTGAMSIPTLRKAFEYATGIETLTRTKSPAVPIDKARLIQVLGLDSCLMSTLELAYEVRGFVDYLVASEGFVPNTGWPYGFLLTQLKEKLRSEKADAERRASARRYAARSEEGRADADNQLSTDLAKILGPRSICSHLVEDCADFYDTYLPAGVSFDIAACELKSLEDVSEALEALVSAFIRRNGKEQKNPLNKTEQNAVILAHWRAQSFKFDEYTDLGDLCGLLRDDPVARRVPGLGDACERLLKAIDRAVFGSRHVGIDSQYAQGLSVYFPWSRATHGDQDPLDAYGKLAFAEATKWDEFLAAYLESTARPARPPKNGEKGEYFPRTVQAPADGAAGGFPHKFAPGYNKFAPGYNKFAPGYNKYAAGYNKYAAGYNKFLVGMLGERAPWSMKNPPRRVWIPKLHSAARKGP